MLFTVNKLVKFVGPIFDRIDVKISNVRYEDLSNISWIKVVMTQYSVSRFTR